ncbi:MAG: hypothetical protein AAGI03_05115 [Pseudomonadota bacterium]
MAAALSLTPSPEMLLDQLQSIKGSGVALLLIGEVECVPKRLDTGHLVHTGIQMLDRRQHLAATQIILCAFRKRSFQQPQRMIGANLDWDLGEGMDHNMNMQALKNAVNPVRRAPYVLRGLSLRQKHKTSSDKPC